MQLYAITLLVMAVLWFGWISIKLIRKSTKPTQSQKVVTDTELCEFYQVNDDALKQCRNARLITVYFNEQGRIIQLEPQLDKRGF
jgi:poly-beta-1,6-N-acetyl-D-glucosamine biosynthesis protein PgaD